MRSRADQEQIGGQLTVLSQQEAEIGEVMLANPLNHFQQAAVQVENAQLGRPMLGVLAGALQ